MKYIQWETVVNFTVRNAVQRKDNGIKYGVHIQRQRFQGINMEKKDKSTEIREKSFTLGFEAGEMDGTLKEAENSLRRRFTSRELDALTLLVWFSPVMQSLRDRITILEKKVGISG